MSCIHSASPIGIPFLILETTPLLIKIHRNGLFLPLASQFFFFFSARRHLTYYVMFPDSSVGKESACNEGDLGLIPGLGRSPGEGKGYPLQYSGEFHGLFSPWGCRVRHDWATFSFTPFHSSGSTKAGSLSKLSNEWSRHLRGKPDALLCPSQGRSIILLRGLRLLLHRLKSLSSAAQRVNAKAAGLDAGKAQKETGRE